MPTIPFRTLPLLLALTATAPVLAQSSDQEEELALAYGEQPVVSIATGRQQPLSRAPAVATVITAHDIKAMGATDLDQVLESVPGLHVSVSSLAYDPIYLIRGIASTYNPHVLMLVNGLPITNVFAGNRGFAWGGFPLENVARVEVIRGPGSALYGADAFAGVINVITKTAEDMQGTEVGVRVGSYESRDGWIQHGSREGDLETTLYLRAGSTDGQKGVIAQDLQAGLDKTVFSSSGPFPSPAASLAPGPVNVQREALDARADLAYKRWRFRTGYQEREVGMGAGLAESLDPRATIPTSRLYLDLTYRAADWVPDWEVAGTLGFYDIKDGPPDQLYMLFPPGAAAGTFPEGIQASPSHSERHTTGELSAFYTGWAGHLLRLGTGYRLEDLYETAEAKNFRIVIDPASGQAMFVRWDQGLAGAGPSDIYLLPHRREVMYAFAQDEWSLAPDWTLTAGIRQDHYSDFGDTTNPRLALVWDAAYNLVVKALHGRAFRAPSFREQYNINNPVAIGNPRLEPETITTNELATSWQPLPTLQTNFNLFHYQMHDIIRDEPNTDGTGGKTAQNAGDQSGRGMELEGIWDATRDLRLTANLSLQRSIDERRNEDAGVAPHQHMFARADWQFAPRWQLGGVVNHVANRHRQPDDSRPALADYTTADLSLRREKWLGIADVSLLLQNLFDADAREPSLAPGNIPYDLPLPGRTVNVQMEIHL